MAHTDNGTVHEVTGFKPTKQKTEEHTRIRREPRQSGEKYIKAQQNLPIRPSSAAPERSAAAPTGSGQP